MIHHGPGATGKIYKLKNVLTIPQELFLDGIGNIAFGGEIYQPVSFGCLVKDKKDLPEAEIYLMEQMDRFFLNGELVDSICDEQTPPKFLDTSVPRSKYNSSTDQVPHTWQLLVWSPMSVMTLDTGDFFMFALVNVAKFDADLESQLKAHYTDRIKEFNRNNVEWKAKLGENYKTILFNSKYPKLKFEVPRERHSTSLQDEIQTYIGSLME